MSDQLLVMIASAPVLRLPDGRLRLDTKFVEGARRHVRDWGGPVRFVLWQDDAVVFGQEIAAADLGFDLTVLDSGAELDAAVIADAAVVAAAADLHHVHGLPAIARQAGVPLVYTIEYTLGTRLRILWLDDSRSLTGKLRGSLWTLAQERRCRAALRAANGLQCNGWPARDAYGRLNGDTLLFLDGRMRRDMLVCPHLLARRLAPRDPGAPLRIAHSGRLEPLKGAQDIIPVALALRAAGIAFTLDIWGAGSVAPAIADAIRAERLDGIVRLHDPLPFETGLVPALTRDADLFLSCHRQSDPSCSYLEAMGCGLPVVGYDNGMLRALAAESGAAETVTMGDTAGLARAIGALAADTARLAGAAMRARAYAAAHDFETEFARRMAHLRRIATGYSP